jgi:hypothetical protein
VLKLVDLRVKGFLLQNYKIQFIVNFSYIFHYMNFFRIHIYISVFVKDCVHTM